MRERRTKIVLCSECGRVFNASWFSPVRRCKDCANRHRLKQIKRWKKNNKDKIKIYNHKYYSRRKRHYIRKTVLGTVKAKDLKVNKGHVNGWVELVKKTGSLL